MANKPFKKGTLKLVPGTTKFYGFPEGKEPTSNCLVCMGALVKNDDDVPVTFYLGPQMDLPKMGRGFAPPFWFVTTTEKEVCHVALGQMKARSITESTATL